MMKPGIGRRLSLIVAALMLWSLVGCATTAGIPASGLMPQGASFSGLWYSDQFEHMYLYQSGDQVEGVYAYGNAGTISGEVEGNLLLFKWEEPGDRGSARRTLRGQGYLQVVEEGQKLWLRGEWGYNEDRRGAGPWTAEFIRELEEEDPRTLEEVRRVH